MQPSKVLYPFIFLSIFSLIYYGCAQKTGLSGGPVDKIPPKLIQTEPPNFSANFSTKKIELYFNEPVKLFNPSTEILVSPPFNSKPELIADGKKIIIQFSDSFRNNTTYHIQLGKSIQDVTEGNATDSANFFVFSTGPEIDSFNISGTVLNALTGELIKDAWVMLYSVGTDSLFKNGIPFYYTKTNEKGMFEIKYIAEGQYEMYGLLDKNSNVKYDLPSEEIAFYSNKINISEELSQEYTLRVFDEEEHIQTSVLKSQFFKPAKLWLVFSKSIQKITFDSTIHYQITSLLPDDTVEIFFSDTSILNQQKVLLFSVNDTIKDSIKIRNIKPAETFKLTAPKKEMAPFDTFIVKTTTSILKIIDSAFVMMLDSERVQINPIIHKNTLAFFTNWEEEKKYSLSFYPNSIISIYSDTLTDTICFEFSIQSLKQYVAIDVSFKEIDSTQTYIFQLLTEKGELVKETYFTGNRTQLNNIFVNKYKARLIHDENKNKKWDSGNLKYRKQPEMVWYYPSNIELNNGFDLDLEWTIVKQ